MSIDGLAHARRHLQNVRVVQRNLVYAVGLPLHCCREEMLRRPEWFGKFGKIVKISANRNGAYSTVQHGPTGSAYVTFERDDDALRCIAKMDGLVVDAKTIRACFGTTKYCNAFLRGQPCLNPDCLYLHDLGRELDSFTKEEMLIKYGTKGQIFHHSTHPDNGAHGGGPGRHQAQQQAPAARHSHAGGAGGKFAPAPAARAPARGAGRPGDAAAMGHVHVYSGPPGGVGAGAHRASASSPPAPAAFPGPPPPGFNSGNGKGAQVGGRPGPAGPRAAAGEARGAQVPVQNGPRRSRAGGRKAHDGRAYAAQANGDLPYAQQQQQQHQAGGYQEGVRQAEGAQFAEWSPFGGSALHQQHVDPMHFRGPAPHHHAQQHQQHQQHRHPLGFDGGEQPPFGPVGRAAPGPLDGPAPPALPGGDGAAHHGPKKRSGGGRSRHSRFAFANDGPSPSGAGPSAPPAAEHAPGAFGGFGAAASREEGESFFKTLLPNVNVCFAYAPPGPGPAPAGAIGGGGLVSRYDGAAMGADAAPPGFGHAAARQFHRAGPQHQQHQQHRTGLGNGGAQYNGAAFDGGNVSSLAAQLEQSLDTFRSRRPAGPGPVAHAKGGGAAKAELGATGPSDAGARPAEASGSREARAKAADEPKAADNGNGGCNGGNGGGGSRRKGGYKNQNARKRERRAERKRRENSAQAAAAAVASE